LLYADLKPAWLHFSKEPSTLTQSRKNKTQLMRSLLLALLLLGAAAAYPQNSKQPADKAAIYKVKLTQMTGQTISGILGAFTDTTIVLVAVSGGSGLSTSFDYHSIRSIRFKRVGSTGRGILIGAISGTAIGLIIGFVSGDDKPGTIFGATASEKAIAAGLGLGTFGVGFGAIFGGLSGKKFTVDGSLEQFSIMRASMTEN
jgi:hypothetical protein